MLSVFDYGFNSTATVAPPNNAMIRFDAGSPYTSVTKVWADFDSSDSQISIGAGCESRGRQPPDDSGQGQPLAYAEFTVTAPPIDSGTYVKMPVTHKAHGGTPLATQAVLVRITTPAAVATARIGAVGIVIDGGGSVITTGVKGFVEVPFAGTITAATLLSTDAAVTSGRS